MRKIALAILLLIVSTGSALAQRSITGEVVDVLDGKTLALNSDTGRSIVELQYIEVPQKGALADTVKSHLRQLTMGKQVIYTPHIIRADRSAGVVEIGGVDMAGQMLRDGAAWHVPTMLSGQSATESEYYSSLEALAKKEDRGVWASVGVKPPWESPERPEVSSQIAAAEQSSQRRSAPVRNPRLGDTGMLLTAYDPASRTGYVSTGLLGVSIDPEHPDQRMAVDVTWYYKEDDHYRRTGSFVFTLYTDSPKGMFDKDNALVLYGVGSPVTMPVARRQTRTWNGHLQEQLLYRLDRKVIDRLVNNDSAFLKIRSHLLVASTGRYWFYTLLQISG